MFLSLITLLISSQLISGDIDCSGSRVCLKDITDGKYSAKGFNGTWISDSEIFWLDEELNFSIFNFIDVIYFLINITYIKKIVGYKKKKILCTFKSKTFF